jgi:hypothetical protein
LEDVSSGDIYEMDYADYKERPEDEEAEEEYAEYDYVDIGRDSDGDGLRCCKT